jgi:3-methylfumaryl-CoA hydratase
LDSAQEWSDYIGRTEESHITISSDRIRGLAALMDYPEPPWPDNQVPPTGHWCALFPYTRQSQLGQDGHEERGVFIPPLRYSRRMWAGGRIEYMQPWQVDHPVLRRSTLLRIEDKHGRSGPMTLVTVLHEYLNGTTLLLREEQDIVYRDAPVEPAPKPVVRPFAVEPADWSREITPDTTLLFRYSAVTFNGHRIHYDREYVQAEGYPGLLVHAPLTATLLIDLFQRANPGVGIRQFRFSARSPMYDGYPLRIRGRHQLNAPISLWSEACDGSVSITAELETV